MMASRIVPKIGDIFSAPVDETNRKYFQLIAFDVTQLNSDVIRVFATSYPVEVNPTLQEILAGEIDFYAHCVVKWGVKMDLWSKIGNTKEVGPTDHILFRGTSDYGLRVGQEPVKISRNWYVWRIGKDFIDVGELKGESRRAEIGVIMTPSDIVHRMKTGEYEGYYPGFE